MMEYLKNWTHFEFKEGNPFVTFTEKRKKEIFKKYGNKVTKLKNGYYYINNTEERTACNGE